ncbi:hypothetical protein [Qipengyuania sp. JC766]|uniref:hypothetical protein n=1 Tax=Qipengyuania sp. JC766 TaxID=3232139 RepID=UPI003459D137
MPDEQIQGLEVSVLCNAPNYRLSVLGENGPLPVEIRSSSETESSVKAVGSSILVSAKQPGLQVLDLEFQGGLAGANGIYRIQLDGF